VNICKSETTQDPLNMLSIVFLVYYWSGFYEKRYKEYVSYFIKQNTNEPYKKRLTDLNPVCIYFTSVKE